ncbi:MAG: DNA-directed RNA polymerase core subunit rpc10 [Piccolia ochrophora]|nr:MAG: DNA-directed RNA polymerase core subunit rpc10 [Piccolia ochrophora]
MSREAYQPPTESHTYGAGGYSSQLGGEPASEGVGPSVTYVCGDCNSKVALKRGDPIRCKECGHRVLYKERTRRMVQFEAR